MGVYEVSRGVPGAPGQALILDFEVEYVTDRFVVINYSSDVISVNTINAKQKTFTSSGRTGTYQFSSISGVTYTLTEAEACGYCMHDSGTSIYVILPDPDPGTGSAGMLGQLMLSLAGIDATVTDTASGATTIYVDGTSTPVATGAVITTSTLGEYFTWEPIFVAEYGWRWAIRIQDD